MCLLPVFKLFNDISGLKHRIEDKKVNSLKIFWIGPLGAINTFSLELGVVIKLFWVNRNLCYLKDPLKKLKIMN